MREPLCVAALSDVLSRSSEVAVIAPDREYREITVRLWGRGVVERGRVPGSSVSGKRFLAREGQLILSRIDARNGAVGVVPGCLDGAIVTNDFPLYDIDASRLLPEYLETITRTHSFVQACRLASEGTTNRKRLKDDRFKNIAISIPSLAAQHRLVARVQEAVQRVDQMASLRDMQQRHLDEMLASRFAELVASAPRLPMKEVAPLVRRPVPVDPRQQYPELGIRSFGKGTFHKPAVSGSALGKKRIFRIEPGDLLFSNVFAWEGAVAVAQENDAGRVGSHRFISRVPRPTEATSHFLKFFFLTDEGLARLGEASPGGAGRNRTLGLESLDDIEVPVPPLEAQRDFDSLQERTLAIKLKAAVVTGLRDSLLSAIRETAVKGDL